MGAFLEFVSQQRLELTLLAIVIIALIVYLVRNRQNIVIQPFIRFGKFNILSMALVRTGWGIDVMERWAKKYAEWVKLFGLVSIGVGFVGILTTFWVVIDMAVKLFQAPQFQQVSVVFPFTNVPGIGYLNFSHWIIAIFLLSTVHEFAHGVVGKVNGIKINKTGLAVLGVFYIPIVPAAFVEPDEKEMKKHTDVERYSMLAAGPVSNFVLALVFFLLLVFAVNPLVSTMMQPVGFSFGAITPNYPAAAANITANTIYNQVNGMPATSAFDFIAQLNNTKPGDVLTIGVVNASGTYTYAIHTVESPAQKFIAYVGIQNPANELDFKSHFAPLKDFILWFKQLIWVCLILNLGIGLMNLMPLFITDGGQMVQLFTTRIWQDQRKARKAYILINSICLIVILLALFMPKFI